MGEVKTLNDLRLLDWGKLLIFLYVVGKEKFLITLDNLSTFVFLISRAGVLHFDYRFVMEPFPDSLELRKEIFAGKSSGDINFINLRYKYPCLTKKGED